MKIILIIIGLITLVWLAFELEDYTDAKEKGGQEFEQYKQRKEQSNLKMAYGKGYNVKCPNCGRLHVKEITTAQRATSVAVFGFASGKIGKSYECPNCKYRW